MRPNLKDEDKRVIDLLLDQGLSSQATTSGRAGFMPAAIDDVRARLRKADEVLSVLRHMPVMEPPADLVAKTMRQIDASVANGEGQYVPPTAPLFDVNGPLA